MHYSRTITILLSLSLIACSGGITNTYDDTGPIAVSDPDIAVLEEVVEFTEAEELGQRKSATLALQNIGEGTLTVSDIAILAPFSVGIGSFTIAPGASTQVSVYFEPAEYGVTEGSLSILSDDPDSPTVEVLLVGSVNTDRDDDGYDSVAVHGGDDCDDLDPTIHPGAPDVYYDGVDSNCLGDNDFDQDMDGYEAEYFNEDVSNNGGDCNDVVDWIYPDADDDWYDGVDSNCDGENDWDSDGDGYGSASFGMGQDCDDFDADVYPNAPERFNNKLDDCNGTMDLDVAPSTAETSWFATGAYQGVGSGILATDIDSDGIDDMIIGAPLVGGSGGYGQGTVSVFLSTVQAHDGENQMGAAWNSFQGDSTSGGLGASIESMDWDGSGTTTIAIGSPGESSNTGAIYLIDTDDVYGYGDTADSHTKIVGSSSYGYYVGYNMAPNLDLNGDGASDVLFEYLSSTSTSGTSNIGLLYGGTEGVISMSSIDARWYTNSVGSNPSREGLSEGGDVNGDGIDDWVFSDPDYDVNFENDGAVFVLWGDSAEYSSSGDAFTNDASIVATSRKYSRGGYFTSIIPDLDDDGLQEIAWSEKASGDVYILSGADASSGGVFEGGDSMAVMEYSESWTPSVMRTVADLDDDGHNEWYVSISGSSGSAAGRVYIYNGTGISGVVENNTDLFGSLKGSSDDFDVDFGNAVTTGDLDGDGRTDMVISDPSWEYDVDGDGSANTNAGAVYLFWNL